MTAKTKKAKRKTKSTKVEPTVKIPTWGELRSMAEEIARCIEKLSGRAFPADSIRGPASHLTPESYYTLSFLKSIEKDPGTDGLPIVGAP